jgi:hypothetical protein
MISLHYPAIIKSRQHQIWERRKSNLGPLAEKHGCYPQCYEGPQPLRDYRLAELLYPYTGVNLI